MKGVILVGGLGTRLAPMTKVTNKHLLPVGRFPMVYYPLHALAEAGVSEIILITGGNSPGAFLELLHDGSEFGLKTLYYAYQFAPRGIADALRLAEAFVDDDDCLVMLGDNVVDASLRPFVENFRDQGANRSARPGTLRGAGVRCGGPDQPPGREAQRPALGLRRDRRLRL
jgi:glucose-1-phosphate thymidylyltransferase